ncbi:PhzF family phenazine biosynthesis protein [Haloglycomyces albus]|uniref:PhzF family phenazine biosynthesis protein n=1 Tax=Haloglycomyces albus TaxID=526067 RepID=UPI00046CD8DA|nr:PhzF family phenazine biosynthesis protein [Haloglycomyces albus]
MLDFTIVDVFTDAPFAGNQLAIVLDADDLTADHMQSIAREFGYSETIFFLAPTQAMANYRVRIFTPTVELPFAGHPTLGAAVEFVRRNSDRLTADPDGVYTVMQESQAGVMTIAVDGDHAWLTSTNLDSGEDMEAAPLLSAAGLGEADQAGAARTAGAGLTHYFLPVARESVAKATSTAGFASKVYLFHFDAAKKHVHARLFGPGIGVTEDPATGSAALALGVYLHTVGMVKGNGTHRLSISQGTEMGRPSTLDVAVEVTDGDLSSVAVGGRVAAVASGTMIDPSAD